MLESLNSTINGILFRRLPTNIRLKQMFDFDSKGNLENSEETSLRGVDSRVKMVFSTRQDSLRGRHLAQMPVRMVRGMLSQNILKISSSK